MSPSSERGPDVGRYSGWLFLERAHVPARWHERALEVCLVPLLPSEADELLADREPDAGETEDGGITALAARGASPLQIARHLAIPLRSAERRLARLRAHLGAESLAELAAILSRRGF